MLVGKYCMLSTVAFGHQRLGCIIMDSTICQIVIFSIATERHKNQWVTIRVMNLLEIKVMLP